MELRCLNWSAPKQWLSKQSRCWWFEMPSCPLRHHCNDFEAWKMVDVSQTTLKFSWMKILMGICEWISLKCCFRGIWFYANIGSCNSCDVEWNSKILILPNWNSLKLICLYQFTTSILSFNLTLSGYKWRLHKVRQIFFEETSHSLPHWNANIFLKENAFENAFVWAMAVILFMPQYVNKCMVSPIKMFWW